MLTDSCVSAFLQGLEELKDRESKTDQGERRPDPPHERPLERHDGPAERHRRAIGSKFVRGHGNIVHVYAYSGPPTRAVHGQRPSISTVNDQLRNVRTKTRIARIATLVRVCSSATVRIMSAATSSS